MIRLAMIGTGGIAKTHAQASQALGNCELVAVVNHRKDSMEQFAQQFDIKRQYLTIDDLLADGNVDGVIICTPNYLHAPQTIQALEAGIHALVEKPMAMNVDEAKKMLDMSKTSNAILQIAHCWRFDGEVQYMRDQITSGVIGKVIRTKGYSVHTHWGPSGWFTQKSLAGGGALADMGIHAIDVVRFLLGDPEPDSVYAKIGTYYGDYDVDDTGIVTINWKNGVSSTVEFGWWQPHSGGIAASTQFYGDGGFAQLFPTQIRIIDSETHQLNPIETRYSDIRNPHVPMTIYENQLAHFVDCIQKNKHPSPGGVDGYINMQIVGAAYKSSQIGQVVTI